MGTVLKLLSAPITPLNATRSMAALTGNKDIRTFTTENILKSASSSSRGLYLGAKPIYHSNLTSSTVGAIHLHRPDPKNDIASSNRYMCLKELPLLRGISKYMSILVLEGLDFWI